MEEGIKNELQKIADSERRLLSDFIRLELEKIIESKKLGDTSK